MKKFSKVLLGIAIFIVAIFVVIALLGMYKFNYLSSKDGYDVDGNKIMMPQEENIQK
jgi:cell division protein YceG involved in septum cleavage